MYHTVHRMKDRLGQQTQMPPGNKPSDLTHTSHAMQTYIDTLYPTIPPTKSTVLPINHI